MRKHFSYQSIAILFGSIVVAFFLRRYFLFEPGYEMDINTFIMWSNKITEGGFWSLYTSNYQSGLDYPPLIPYIGNYWLNLRSVLSWTDQEIFKLLPTIAEIIFTLLTVSFIYKSKSKYSKFLIPFVIIQPALALITTAWGQVDSVLSLFIICGFLMLEKNLYLGTLFMFLALLTKPQALFGIFIFYLIILFRKGFMNALKQVGFFLLLTAIAYYIFQLNYADFLAVYFMSSSRYPYTSMNAFNVWWMVNGSTSINMSDAIGSGITFKQLGLTLFAVFLAPAVFYLYKKAKSLSEYFLAGSYIYLLFFVFPTQIHERYLYPAVALLPFAATKDRKIIWILVLISITLFLNNYAVLQATFPQFESLNLLNEYLHLSGSWTKAISLVNVLISIYLALYFIYESFKKTK